MGYEGTGEPFFILLGKKKEGFPRTPVSPRLAVELTLL